MEGKKKMKITVKPSYKYKMSKDELQDYLKMKKSGASKTKNGRAYSRKNYKINYEVFMKNNNDNLLIQIIISTILAFGAGYLFAEIFL